jgi:hypothetical protein
MIKDDVLFGYRQQLFGGGSEESVSAAWRNVRGAPLYLLRLEALGRSAWP